MLQHFFEALRAHGHLNHFFYATQVLLLGAIALAFWYLKPKHSTQFRTRESDRPRSAKPKKHQNPEQDPFAQSRLKQPLLLEGIRIDGEPHEILGVSRNALPDEIQKSYRELMKRYHPDRVGRPGTREWQDAQKIAESLNRAKDTLLSPFRKR